LKFDLHYSNVNTCRDKPRIEENDLLKACLQLVKIFQYEFDTYKKPCESVLTKVNDAINHFVNNDVLIDQSNKYGFGFGSKSRPAGKYMLNDYDDDNSENGYENDDTTLSPGGLIMANSLINSSADVDPNNKEILRWRYIKNPKIYKVFILLYKVY
jgi:hypothetical protein